MATVTKPLALNESLNTTEQTPRNLADVLSEGLAGVAEAIEGGGGGGHSIIDSEGNTMPQETAMQFADSFVSDDDSNGRTIVENVKEVDPADYDSTTDEGIIVTDDGNDALIGAVSDEKITVNGDNSKTLGTLLGEIATALDLTKLKPTSFLVHHNADGEDIVYQAGRILSNGIILTNKFVAGNGIVLSAMSITKNSAAIYKRIYTSSTGAITYGTSDILTSAESITLYYGNRKAVVDLQTTANRCLMSNGESVESALTSDSVETGITGVTAYKVGKVVTLIVLISNMATTINSWNNIGTLPASLRPPVELYFNGIDNLSASLTTNSSQLRIRNGVLQVYAFTGQSPMSPYATITYITNS